MDESFSRVIFVYMALVLGVGKACTLLIWRILPRPRPGLRQEAVEAWQRRARRTSHKETTGRRAGDSDPHAPEPAPTTRDGLPQP
jgi:hypothetical protein